MTLTSSVRSAFDHAIAVVIRAEAENARRAQDAALSDNLARLREALVADKAAAIAAGRPNEELLAELIRWVATWAPANDLIVLGALGRIARAARRAGGGG